MIWSYISLLFCCAFVLSELYIASEISVVANADVWFCSVEIKRKFSKTKNILNSNLIREYTYNISQKVLNTNSLFVINQKSDNIDYEIEPDHHYQVFNFVSGHFYHLRSSYVQHSLHIISNRKEIVPIEPKIVSFIHRPSNGRIIGSYEHVIATGHLYSYNYGHFIGDFLCPLMAMPDEILQKSYIFGKARLNFVNEFFKCLGFEGKYIEAGDREWIYAENLYVTANPNPHCAHFGPLYKKLGDIIKKSLNIYDVIPNRYIVANRKSHMRVIHNVENLTKALQQSFPENKYEIVVDEKMTLEESAKIFGYAKFMFMVVGSNCFKSLVINPKAVIVLVGTKVYDNSAINVIGSNGNKIVFYVEPKVEHAGYSYNIFNISMAIKASSIANYYIEHGCFPNDPVGSVVV
ncbi:hypothetical protein TVAG_351350 [Trichomonas vaginalis G3]|uniref:Glycosyltransferase 61 catalytic domain-containing protein n=1 Tax=Trichomonas vaginalis (strain ATCC PRA-98 / G3) TaxID=412133 RepID=A2DZL9_TRIV3|nr:glycosyltransferase family [Trichomonas vaginalis G3]EAY14087.1 hypothetical protein TVAG_351350 [Trichomonas vaginalis G3]KAI5525097.1 glycosyltransferase family [Trichomonas vaginalis G3]|eukprot:XP_001326310.1 hypothetical protein [Trichomonas vaginalis G3]